MRKKLTKEDIINNEDLTPQEKYHKYIKTEDWQEIRTLVLDRDNHKCRCCSRTEEESSLTVHHSTYKNLFNEADHLEDLITLCRYCHSGIHRVVSNKQRFKFSVDK